MSDTNLRYLLSEPVMESFFDMRSVQPSKDRLHYFDTALEGSTETNSILLQKLYTDIISRSNFDYGTIPDSKGALTKYKDYKLMTSAMDSLNKLFEGKSSDELTMMNKLHDIIISCRKDYEFGYTMDIEILKISYCTSVLALYELINVCILAYTKELRSKSNIEFDFKKVKKKDVLVIRGAKSIIKSYESGQWTQMMKEFKKNPQLLTGASAATEAGLFGKDSLGDAVMKAKSFIQNGGKQYGPQPVPAAKTPLSQTLKDGASKLYHNSNGSISVPMVVGTVIVSLIGIFVAIRALIFFFYNSASKLKDYLHTQKEFVDATVKMEIAEGSSQDVIEKHSKLASKLEGVANFIEFRILKSNTDAKKDMDEANKESYSKAEFKQTGFNGPIEF